MFIRFSKFFLYLAIITPLLIGRRLFFPFITAKALVFRSLIELSLLFFILFVISQVDSKSFLRHSWERIKSPTSIAIILFGTFLLITAFTGVNPSQSIWSNFERGEGVFQIIHYILFFILLRVLFINKKSIERAFLTNFWTSLLISLYGIAQLINGPGVHGIVIGDNVSGTLGNPAYLGGYLLFSLGIIGYFLVQKKELWFKIFISLVGLLQIFLLFKNGTRGPILALFLGLIALFLAAAFIKKLGAKRIIFAILAILMISGATAFFTTHRANFWDKVPYVRSTLNVDVALREIQPRLWTWGSAVSGALERPIVGWGTENFSVAFDKYYNPNHFGIESFFDRTHNIFLEYLISGGLLVFLPWLFFIIFAFAALRKQKKDWWFAVSLAVLVSYLAQAFFLFDVLAIYIAFFLFLAMTLNLQEIKEPAENFTQETHLSISKTIGAVLVSLIIFISLYITTLLPFQKNLLVAKGAILENQPDPAETLSVYQRALEFSAPLGQEEALAAFMRFSLILVGRIDEIEEISGTEQSIARVSELVALNNSWFDEYKPHISGLKDAYLNGGLNFRAGVSLIDPENPRIINPIALERGKEIYNQALEISPTRVEFIQTLLNIAQLEGKKETYQNLLKKAQTLRPDINWQSAESLN